MIFSVLTGEGCGLSNTSSKAATVRVLLYGLYQLMENVQGSQDYDEGIAFDPKKIYRKDSWTSYGHTSRLSSVSL